MANPRDASHRFDLQKRLTNDDRRGARIEDALRGSKQRARRGERVMQVDGLTDDEVMRRRIDGRTDRGKGQALIALQFWRQLLLARHAGSFVGRQVGNRVRHRQLLRKQQQQGQYDMDGGVAQFHKGGLQMSSGDACRGSAPCIRKLNRVSNGSLRNYSLAARLRTARVFERLTPQF
ncbi:MAG: hypothetical protein ACM34A_01160 [Bacillota bacterium]